MGDRDMAATHLIFALVLALPGGEFRLIETFSNKSNCRHISKNYESSLCVPVTVAAKPEIESQVKALNELLR
jgi:hypothetical protein